MSNSETILIIEDDATNRAILVQLLKNHYHLLLAVNGEQGIDVARRGMPDLILLDIIMNDMNGFEVCEKLKSNPFTSRIPIIFLTSLSDIKAEQRGLDCGAVDFIYRPISPPILLTRIRTHLLLSRAFEEQRSQNELLELKVTERTLELENTRDAIVVAMAAIIEVRDNETGNHIYRTQHFVKCLAKQLQHQPGFQEQLRDKNIELITKSAPLHDIGKIGIPDLILHKSGLHSPEEFEIMKTHTTIGRDMIAAAQRSLTDDSDFLRYALEITNYHHERWDGRGYPQGLKGDEIPLSARLMALADVYDAMRSKRVYKEAIPHQQIVENIHQQSGKHFDPKLVTAFLQLESEFSRISEEFKDPDL
ncbi:MAG: HD domain-containing phosphohydrolase [Methylococcales bacterium]